MCTGLLVEDKQLSTCKRFKILTCSDDIGSEALSDIWEWDHKQYPMFLLTRNSRHLTEARPNTATKFLSTEQIIGTCHVVIPPQRDYPAV